MNATVAVSAARGKFDEQSSRLSPAAPPATKPAPAAGPLVHPTIDAVARSKMMTDAREIARVGKELLDLIEAFERDHDADSIVGELRAAGLEIKEKLWRDNAAGLLYDARGFEWALGVFLDCFTSDLFSEDAGVLSDTPKRSR